MPPTFFYILVVTLPVVVFNSGLYKPRSTSVVISIAYGLLAYTMLIPHRPILIKGVLVGFVFAILLFHIAIWTLRRLGYKVDKELTKNLAK